MIGKIVHAVKDESHQNAGTTRAMKILGAVWINMDRQGE